MKYILAFFAFAVAQDEDERNCTSYTDCLVDEVCKTVTWISSDETHDEYDPVLDGEIQARSP